MSTLREARRSNRQRGSAWTTEPCVVITLCWSSPIRRATHDPSVTISQPMPRWKATEERTRIRSENLDKIANKTLVVMTRRVVPTTRSGETRE